MIKNYFDYLKEYYKEMKKEEDLYLVRFSPKEIELSNGKILTATDSDEFDRDIIEDILDYNRRNPIE